MVSVLVKGYPQDLHFFILSPPQIRSQDVLIVLKHCNPETMSVKLLTSETSVAHYVCSEIPGTRYIYIYIIRICVCGSI